MAIDYSALKKCMSKFGESRVIVVGDIMEDVYKKVEVIGISPEAPVLVVRVCNVNFMPGGASNVANNILTLGGNVFLYGVVGKNVDGRKLIERLNGLREYYTKYEPMADSRLGYICCDGVLALKGRKTTLKTRIIDPHQQIIRIDEEDIKDINDVTTNNLLDSIKRVENPDVIVISDYNKGVMTPQLVSGLKAYASERRIPLLVDSKPAHKDRYHDVFLLKINQSEAEQMSGIKIGIGNRNDIDRVGYTLSKDLNCNLIITSGAYGMTLFEKDRKSVKIPAEKVEISDIVGAGDTVLATLGLAISSGASLVDAAILANHAGGKKVSKKHTSPVFFEELEGIIRRLTI